MSQKIPKKKGGKRAPAKAPTHGTVSTRVKPETARSVDALVEERSRAQGRDVSRSDVLRELVDAGIEAFEKEGGDIEGKERKTDEG